MTEFKKGDKVKLTEYGYAQYGGPDRYPKDHIYTVEISKCPSEGVCVYNKQRRGWIHKGMGLYKCFELATRIHIGGE